MTPSSLITGNMDYLRRPFVRNVKPGDRVLVLSDTSHDARVWQVVQSILCELGADVTVALFERRPADYYDPPAAVCESMMSSDINVLRRFHRHAALARPTSARWRPAFPAICMDGGMTLEMFQSGAVTDDMKQIAVRKHYVAHGRLRPGREGMPRHLALRHRLHLSRGRPDLRAAAAVRQLRSRTRSSTSTRTRTARAATSTTTCSRPASSTWRRSKAAPTASWSST